MAGARRPGVGACCDVATDVGWGKRGETGEGWAIKRLVVRWNGPGGDLGRPRADPGCCRLNRWPAERNDVSSLRGTFQASQNRKSKRLNSSHLSISHSLL